MKLCIFVSILHSQCDPRAPKTMHDASVCHLHRHSTVHHSQQWGAYLRDYEITLKIQNECWMLRVNWPDRTASPSVWTTVTDFLFKTPRRSCAGKNAANSRLPSGEGKHKASRCAESPSSDGDGEWLPWKMSVQRTGTWSREHCYVPTKQHSRKAEL
jgi:hypothetical protein